MVIGVTMCAMGTFYILAVSIFAFSSNMPQLTPVQRAKVAQLRFQGLNKASALKEMRKLFPEAKIGKKGVDLWFERANTQLLGEEALHTKVNFVIACLFAKGVAKGDFLATKKISCFQTGSGRKRKYSQVEANALQRRLEGDGMTISKLARIEGVTRKTMARFTRRSAEQPDGCHPHVTPEEAPLSRAQEGKRVAYAQKNLHRDWIKENVTFFDDTPVPLDGQPKRRNSPHYRRKGSKKPLRVRKKRKFPPKFNVGLAANACGGLAPAFVHATRRRVKSGKNVGKYTFDHKKMTIDEMLIVVDEMIIPFMERTESKLIVYDCTLVYHNNRVYARFAEKGIEVMPSAGRCWEVEGGYSPNSHETMPNESINSDYKDLLYKAFLKQKPSRRTMHSLYNLISKTAETFPRSLVLAHIGNLPNVLQAIIDKNGKRTKY